MQVNQNPWVRRFILLGASLLAIVVGAAGMFVIGQATAATEPLPDQPGIVPGTPEDPKPAGSKKKKKKKKPRVRIRAKVTKRHVKVGGATVVRGKVKPAGAKRRVIVRIANRVFKTRTAKKSGKFRIRAGIVKTGKAKVRVRALGNKFGKGRKVRRGKVIGYRPVHASYYGPGLYGGGLACGGRLSRSTKGVAHKSLPCGSKITLRYRNRVVHTRVIDRGPFIPGRELDLTTATRNQLGMGDVGVVLMSR